MQATKSLYPCLGLEPLLSRDENLVPFIRSDFSISIRHDTVGMKLSEGIRN